MLVVVRVRRGVRIVPVVRELRPPHEEQGVQGMRRPPAGLPVL